MTETFDCWESHFKPTREKCLKCAEYRSCVQQELFDLRQHKKELKAKNEWNRDYYDLMLGLFYRLRRKRSCDDIIVRLKELEGLDK